MFATKGNKKDLLFQSGKMQNIKINRALINVASINGFHDSIESLHGRNLTPVYRRERKVKDFTCLVIKLQLNG